MLFKKMHRRLPLYFFQTIADWVIE